MRASRSRCELVVVSHPAVLPVNQLVYAEIARRGYRVELFAPARWRHEYSPDELQAKSLPELARHFHPKRVMLSGRPQRHAYLVNPLAELRRLRPAAVFCEQEAFSVAGAQWGLAAWLLGIPFGVQIAENLDRHLPAAVRALRSLVLSRASFVIARSDKAASLAVRWGARGDVSLVPHHVPVWPEPQRIPHKAFTVGYAGRLVDEKGIDTLVAALRHLDPAVDLLVVGDGPLRHWLESADLGTAKLRLVRGTDHAAMSELYAEMDVLVLPSRTMPTWAEQFGRVLVEAMWCGTPVLGSDSGEIPWVIETTGGGEIFPEGDVEALADRLDGLRADPLRARELARRGRERVAALFSVEAVADRFEKALRESGGVFPRARGKPRVALVAHGVHDGGGMERACAELIRQAQNRFDFDVVSADLAPELRPLVRSWTRIGVPGRPIPVKFVVFWLRAGRALLQLDPDLVHTVGAIVPNRVDFTSVHFCHAGFAAAGGQFASSEPSSLRRVNSAVTRRLAIFAERWSYRPERLGVFGCVSAGVAEEVLSHYPTVACILTPNGVDLSRFRPEPTHRSELRDSLRTLPTTTVAIFVGGDWSRKGLAIAIGAVAAARSDGADVELWVVGSGDRGYFTQVAADYGIESHVRFHGVRRDPERFLQAADLFLFPSGYEAFSLASLEAAACGLPLIIPAISGAREVVGDDEGGLVVERSVWSVAQAVIRLAADPELRSTLGAEAGHRVQSYTWEHSVALVTDMYQTLLAPNSTQRDITVE
jgi:UDP-glucose:(heptosyl)LPS alpha-1,3-glucosyltransferase